MRTTNRKTGLLLDPKEHIMRMLRFQIAYALLALAWVLASLAHRVDPVHAHTSWEED